jgi:hypothetical protein
MSTKCTVCPPLREARSKHFTHEFNAVKVILMRKMQPTLAGKIPGESESRMLPMIFAKLRAAHARLRFIFYNVM